MVDEKKMSETLRVFVVDAFTGEVFSGNPAAVCLLENDLPDRLKSKIAAEMNLSETAFVTLDSNGAENFENGMMFGLRWFTPETEVPLCGHATLAAAAVIFHKFGNKSKSIQFRTLSGILKASQDEQSSSVTLDFPLNPPCAYDGANLQELINVVTSGKVEVEDVQLSSTTRKLLLRLSDKHTRKDLEDLTPSTQAMTMIENGGAVRGIIITLRGDVETEGYDFYSRYFAPWVGIPEDPVTGSAHTVLAPYWKTVYGKNEFRARQCSKRGGDLLLRIVDQRVELNGKAVHVLDGTMRIQ